ncbi:MAG TPA: hypothetical protein VHO67_14060 [Polyangia bacterium]|nr:hypothetical protein [Polyangia bacterium]
MIPRAATRSARAVWLWGGALVALTTLARLVWVLAVPTVPVSDFAMYRESANYLSEFRRLDPGFIYMPGFVALLALVKDAGGDLLAQKLLGVLFGGIGAAGVFGLTWALLDRDAAAPSRGRLCPCPHAAVATGIYALWPAGIAMASVVGTDVPAAALVVAALALLVVLAPRRPWTAAVIFGVTMGLAAWIRAVALPLTALSVGVWLARRERLRRALLLAGASVAATLVVLAPWGIRHLRESGALYFTDDHGGVTALIGANPNSEGTYTRALNRMFNDVTGRSVLAEPHHETDQIAYGIVREWWRYEPGYALGLAVTKAERLFDPEDRLFYWPMFRPGVLVGAAATRVASHHDALAALGHGFGLAVLALGLFGVAAAAARRRWGLLALLPFQLSLTATYTIFFAEPRYRLPIEMLAFPFVALALAELIGLGAAIARRPAGEIARARPALVAGAATVLVWWIGWPRLVEAGLTLRARHRWAATEVALITEPRPRLLLWRAAPPLAATSPLAGAPEGVHLRAGAGGTARAQLQLAGGALPAGTYDLTARIAAQKGGGARATLAGIAADVAPEHPVEARARLTHGGGLLRFDASVAGAPGTDVWIDQLRLALLP